jgi:hypothetical protein
MYGQIEGDWHESGFYFSSSSSHSADDGFTFIRDTINIQVIMHPDHFDETVGDCRTPDGFHGYYALLEGP